MKEFKLSDSRFAASLLLVILVAIGITALICRLRDNKPSSGDYQPGRTFTVPELREDFEALETTLMEAHANLYARIDPSDFDRTAEKVRQKLDRTMTEMEFYRVLSPLVAAIGCGHTHLRPSREYEAIYEREARFLPYVLAVFSQRLFIVDELLPTDSSVRGCEILSINGKSAQSVIGAILPNLSGDGAIQTQKLKKLAKNLSLYWDRYIGHDESFSLLIRSPEGDTETIEPTLISRTQYLEKIAAIASEETRPPAEFTFHSEFGPAVLRMKTFYTVDLKKEGIRFKAFFRNIFRRIEESGITNLVIDIRGNAGGSMYLGSELMAYLSEDRFRVLERYQMSPELHLTYKKFIGRDPFITFKWLVTQKKDGRRSFPWIRLLKPQKPKRRSQFKGTVYVLIDGETFSAASLFAALVRSRENTFFVGEETGGSTGGNGVSPIHLTLPHTRLRMQIPFGYVKLALPVEVDGSRGVIPDYIIERTSKDFLAGGDPALDFVLQRTRRDNPNNSLNTLMTESRPRQYPDKAGRGRK